MRILYIQQEPAVYLGLCSLSAFLKKHGHTVGLVIISFEKDWLQAVEDFGPDLVAMSCSTGSHTELLFFADQLKERYPDVLIMLGGSHPTYYPRLIEHPSVDIVALGEGEYAMQELLEKLEGGEDFSRVKNLHVKSKDGKITRNPLRPLEQHLDVFPFPDRSLYDKYDNLRQTTTYWTITGRGCPYDCSYCYNSALKAMYKKEDARGKYARRRSASNVIEELKAVKAQWGIKDVEFQDDIFTLYPEQFLYPFLGRYKKEIGLPFWCQIRPDLVTENIIAKLKEAGCTGLMIALETANSEISKVLARNITKQQIIDAAGIIHGQGIRLKTCSMLGSPGETLETAFETLELNQQMKAEFPLCSLTQPYPKTALMDYCVKNGLLEEGFDVDDFEDSFFIDTPVKFQDKHQVLRLQKVFGICAKWPFLTPVVRRLIRIEGLEWLFNLAFKGDLAYWVYRQYNYNLIDFIKIGLITGYLSRSERRLVARLVCYGFTFEQIDRVLRKLRRGKWAHAPHQESIGGGFL